MTKLQYLGMMCLLMAICMSITSTSVFGDTIAMGEMMAGGIVAFASLFERKRG